MQPTEDELRIEFNRSSMNKAPDGLKPAFQMRNDYPTVYLPVGTDSEFPWLGISFKDEPKRYLETLKDYCLLGMPESDFNVHENKARDWYHAPWMHLSSNGREPIHGLTYERPTPPHELSITQDGTLQTWACSYFNTPAASVFGEIWLPDPANPTWNSSVSFPRGSVVFKVLMSDATEKALPFLKGSPTWEALIGKDPYHPEDRTLATVRFLQLDVATADGNAKNGWVFGTFIYDGRCANSPLPDWRRVLPVGLMWGNDPQLNQKEFDENGKRPVESWVNPAADALLRQLKGDRPSWGWNGRMNGPADNFISACSSCHGVAQKLSPTLDPKSIFKILVPAVKERDRNGQFLPVDDEKTMLWFANSGILGENPGEISGDFSLQLMIGYYLFERLKLGLPIVRDVHITPPSHTLGPKRIFDAIFERLPFRDIIMIFKAKYISRAL